MDYKARDSGFIFLLEKFTYNPKDYNSSSELFPYVFKETFSDKEGGQLLFLLYKHVDSFNQSSLPIIKNPNTDCDSCHSPPRGENLSTKEPHSYYLC